MKKKKLKLIPILIFIIGLIVGYKNINFKHIEISNQELVNIIFKNSIPTSQKELTIKLFANQLTSYCQDTTNFLNLNLRNKTQPETTPVLKEETLYEPIIYIYNSHQTEEYETSTILDYSIKPTVTINNYILEEIFTSNNLPTYVEEQSIKEILNQHSWNYTYSYAASRIMLEQRKTEYPTLKYFIDVHRDSLVKDKTTVTIDGKEYAKLLFLIGLENPNYEQNLAFTEKINNKLNEKYPSLSKGIYKKGGAGVNGVYNQDFSEYTILIEVGGYQNTPIEILNSMLAFSECFMEVITSNEA